MRDSLPQHPKVRQGNGGELWLGFGEYGREVEVAGFSGDGQRVLTVHEVGVPRVWEVASGELAGEIRPESPLAGSRAAPVAAEFKVFVEAAALDATGAHALLGLNDGTAGVFRVADGQRLSTLHDPGAAPAAKWGVIRAVAYSPDYTRVLVGFPGAAVGVWDAR